jgi:hypothetical protein
MWNKAKKTAQAYDWVILKVSSARVERLGTVSAPTREAAIEQASEDFDIEPSDKKRLIAQAG